LRTNVAKHAAGLTPEQQRLFHRLFPLAEVPTGEAIREQFHCSRATAEAVAIALADFRLTPAERRAKAKADAATKVAQAPRRHLKEITKPGHIDAAFSEDAQDQADRLDKNGWAGPKIWSDELGKWVVDTK
jgi:hypothetical protein